MRNKRKTIKLSARFGPLWSSVIPVWCGDCGGGRGFEGSAGDMRCVCFVHVGPASLTGQNTAFAGLCGVSVSVLACFWCPDSSGWCHNQTFAEGEKGMGRAQCRWCFTIVWRTLPRSCKSLFLPQGKIISNSVIVVVTCF